LIVGLAGPIVRSKATIGSHLEENFGFIYLRYSILLERMLVDSGKPHVEVSILAFGQRLGDELGPREVPRQLMSEYDSGNNYAVDGIC
jgi:hypothetical protein